MDIVRQKLDERIYFWHVEIVFKKVPFYVCNFHGRKYLREREREKYVTFIRKWRSPWGNQLKSQLSYGLCCSIMELH